LNEDLTRCDASGFLMTQEASEEPPLPPEPLDEPAGDSDPTLVPSV
jgi:hypothetical protein